MTSPVNPTKATAADMTIPLSSADTGSRRIVTHTLVQPPIGRPHQKLHASTPGTRFRARSPASVRHTKDDKPAVTAHPVQPTPADDQIGSEAMPFAQSRKH